MLHAATVCDEGSKDIRIVTSGHEKTRIITMLVCTGNGHRILPFIILKRKTMLKDRLPNSITVHMHLKG